MVNFKTILPVALWATSAVAAPSAYQKPAPPARPYFNWAKTKYLFTFGDSYTQTGFNTSLTQPAPGNPLGNPTYPGWTSANGPAWIDYLTVNYNKTLTLTYNLAYGGATVDSGTVPPWRSDVISLTDQVHDLWNKNYKHPKHPWTAKDSLFGFFIGINDIGNSWWWSNVTDHHAFRGQVIKKYFTLVDELYTAGARNFFFINVPDVARAPLYLAQGDYSVNAVANATDDWNKQVQQNIDALKKKKKDVTAIYYDSNALFKRITNNPAKYGLKNVTGTCDYYEQHAITAPDLKVDGCDSVNEYFWMNSLHPMFPVHKELAKDLANVLVKAKKE
ncbi:hypothetical protein HK097_005940 [Rhizophlyctis rosea]|uniref:Carbohydrate esterase family 16 protein n=1 Tax=Rhizophlyctis rosea TaxID=64517 RepID=A0AAD5SEM5_9FUNG|nr:hypothetical protein HK097_005940 [Rhizophlyctis rosea]